MVECAIKKMFGPKVTRAHGLSNHVDVLLAHQKTSFSRGLVH